MIKRGVKTSKMVLFSIVFSFCIFSVIGISASTQQLGTGGGINRADLNEDWVNDIKDIALLSQQYNSRSSSTGWRPLYDLNKDNIIDIYDVSFASKYIGLEKGNSDGNISNMGFITRSEARLYYCNYLDNGYLYRVDVAGTNHRKLVSDVALLINVVGEWVYYVNGTDLGMYRVKTDGTGRQRLSSDFAVNMTVYNGWIYYANYSGNGEIYKIKYDGTGRTKVTNGPAVTFSIENDIIYYIGLYDGNMYRIKTDGTGNARIGSDTAYMLSVSEGIIYYINSSDNFRVYRIKPDGTGRTRLNFADANYLNVLNEWIYYADDADNGNIYKMKIDGTGRTKLTNDPVWYIHAVNNKIYFEDIYDNVIEMNNDGTGRRVFGAYSSGSLNTDAQGTESKFEIPSAIKDYPIFNNSKKVKGAVSSSNNDADNH
jgi:hypothetical protein